MAGMKINNPSSIKLLPRFMQSDDANIGIATAVDELIRAPGIKAKTLRVWDQIDNLDEEMLDELAWELNIDWYEDTMSIEAKRETIKTAKLIQEHRGTVWAIEQIVSNTFGTGAVVEWPEYGGQPYHFKVVTDYPLYTQELIDKFIKQVNAAKRPGTYLDVIEYAFEGTSTTYIFTEMQAIAVTSSAIAS